MSPSEDMAAPLAGRCRRVRTWQPLLLDAGYEDLRQRAGYHCLIIDSVLLVADDGSPCRTLKAIL